MRRAATAFTVEPDEAPVSSNELLEANVVSIRRDLTDFRAEFRAVIARIDHDIRAMASKAESEIKTAVAKFDEALRDVRQDFREFRAEGKTLRDKIDATHTSLTAKADGNYASLDQKIDTKVNELRADMRDMRADIKDIRVDIKEMRTSISDLKGMQKAILWVLGVAGSAVIVAGTLLTIAKTLHWI